MKKITPGASVKGRLMNNPTTTIVGVYHSPAATKGVWVLGRPAEQPAEPKQLHLLIRRSIELAPPDKRRIRPAPTASQIEPYAYLPHQIQPGDPCSGLRVRTPQVTVRGTLHSKSDRGSPRWFLRTPDHETVPVYSWSIRVPTPRWEKG